MINVGTQKDTSQAAIALAERYPEGVYATVGLHPVHTESSYHDAKELGLPPESSAKEGDSPAAKGFTSRGEDFDFEYYKKLAMHPKVVAIGECGLDYYRLEESTKEKQHEAFDQQISLAVEVQKPLMIHCRSAFDDLIPNLQPSAHNLKPSIIHFFSGTKDDARKLLDMGFSFSFGGVITFARDYDEVVQYIPLDRIVTETDAPYITPTPHRGKRNEPLYVMEVIKKLAEIKNEFVENVCAKTVLNAKNIFGL